MNSNQSIVPSLTTGDTTTRGSSTSIIYNWVKTLSPSSSNFKEELMVAMQQEENLWVKRILTKIDTLLDATTVDKFWNIIQDNAAQLKALELLLKLQWMDVWNKWININLFNIPNPNEKLWY